MAPKGHGQPPEQKCATCRKRRTLCDGKPGTKCSACEKYQRLCSYATPNDNNPVHPLTLLTKSFLDGTKAFYQLGATISCFVPAELRRAPVDINNHNNPLQTHLTTPQQTLTTNDQSSRNSTIHQPTPTAPSTMGRTKASRQPDAANPDNSKMLSHKASTPNTTTKNSHPKSHLTIQERLQDQSILHWHQPIDEALDLHLHGLLTVTGKTFTRDSWTKWPKNYCRAMLQLVPLVSAPRANELLTAKMAKFGYPDRDIGTQPRVVWDVVNDMKGRIGQARKKAAEAQGKGYYKSGKI